MLLFKRLICAPHCVLHSFIFIFSFFIFHFFGRAPRRKRLRVGLSALTRRIPADVCALPTRFPRFILNFSFFILLCVSYPLLSLTHPNAHASARTDNSRPAVRSKLSHQHHSITHDVGANLVFALIIIVFALFCVSP